MFWYFSKHGFGWKGLQVSKPGSSFCLIAVNFLAAFSV